MHSIRALFALAHMVGSEALLQPTTQPLMDSATTVRGHSRAQYHKEKQNKLEQTHKHTILRPLNNDSLLAASERHLQAVYERSVLLRGTVHQHCLGRPPVGVPYDNDGVRDLDDTFFAVPLNEGV